ncbi:MAG: polysaccharide ABC transporter ATP-binding protein [Gemmatimonadota bacterium]|nr:polysaccharide ABC transporter ATP-binding protein [Gemmatimonadota bacterium]
MSERNGRSFIAFDEVWKKFRYGEVHDRLRDAIPALVRRMAGHAPPADGLWSGEFWALRDVSFSVAPGEALGLIGPNGAGKSTALKLLTRILRPTRGRCAASGRVGALIDVAAGFHPDLTGRENIYLQGAIMGMPRREIGRKFDAIVEFSGIPLFIDTPVKRYSSGMHARLGFAIAAHLDPDILIVDEVLSVGDASFQQKAFARVEDLVRSGIPVVVVSHQLDAIASLCTHGVLLDRGTVRRRGTPQECITAYLHGLTPPAEAVTGEGAVRIESIEIVGGESVRSGKFVVARLYCAVRSDAWVQPETIVLRVRSAQTGECVFETSSDRLGTALPAGGTFELHAELQLNVPAGVYVLESAVWDRQVGRSSFTGPVAYVDVRGGEEFGGAVQMNPRLTLAMTADVVAPPEPR